MVHPVRSKYSCKSIPRATSLRRFLKLVSVRNRRIIRLTVGSREFMKIRNKPRRRTLQENQRRWVSQTEPKC